MNAPEDILNFVPIDARLACAGQPTAGQLAALPAHGFVSVVNLATAASTGHLKDEAAICAAAGLEFQWLPVAWDAPTQEDFQAFRAWLAPRRDRRVLIHCAKNWRASLFVALFRVLEEGRAPDEAWDDVLEVWEPDTTWSALARDLLTAAGIPLPAALHG